MLGAAKSGNGEKQATRGPRKAQMHIKKNSDTVHIHEQ